jgi:serpin B
VHTISGPNGSVQLVADTKPFTSVDASKLDAVVAAEQRLSLALLNQVGSGSNVTVSPASLYLALGMLQNGARGATADEISKALQASGISTDDQNAGLAALTNSLAAAAAKDGIEFDSANSLWQQKGFPVKQQFLDALAAYYKSGMYQVDYAGHNADALNAINAWTSDKTHGKITKLFDQLDPSTVLVLANAIYFHASWQTPFDKNLTKPGEFTTSNGSQVSVKFMSGEPGLRAAATGDYQAVALPYRGGRFEALAVMPTSGSLTDFVQSLTPNRVDAIATGLQPGLSVAMPRFTTTSTLDLVPTLKALGMHLAFGGGDLSGLSNSDTTAVDQVIQRDYLQVGEKGTTAAAVTGIAIVGSATRGGPDVRIDHPFLFLVRDTQTGAILFASEITDPSAE